MLNKYKMMKTRATSTDSLVEVKSRKHNKKCLFTMWRKGLKMFWGKFIVVPLLNEHPSRCYIFLDKRKDIGIMSI